MIRDPSDGSVKEKPVPEPGIPEKQFLSTGTSGLPTGSGKSKDLKRLEESREWLANYHKKAGSI